MEIEQMLFLPAKTIETLADFFMEAPSEPEQIKRRLFCIFITLADLAPKDNALLNAFAVENIGALAAAIVAKLREARRIDSVMDVLTQERGILSHVKAIIVGINTFPDQITAFNPLTVKMQEFDVREIKRATIEKIGDIFHHLFHEALLQSHQMTKVPRISTEVLA